MRWLAVITWFLTIPLLAQGEDIRGAKPLIEIPAPEKASAWLLYALIGITALLLIAGIIWWLKRRKRPEVSVEQWARHELDGLQRNGGAMVPGDFALAASRVVRVFIERKFGLAAPKRTTEEFLQELSISKNEALVTRMEPLRGFLKSCDMAKFAGTNLESSERENLIAKAKAFVDTQESSKPKEAA